ncbi:hypothetical protein ON010_g16686 [Phytophthora cinnamomi]|nr:hypothetical protein ON010_g16686 [Phytophthora cinnamomi]
MESKYEMLDEIGAPGGHGGTSVVYKCRERRSGVVHACKIIDRRAVEREHNVLMEQFQASRAGGDTSGRAFVVFMLLTPSKICMVRRRGRAFCQAAVVLTEGGSGFAAQVTEYMSGGELFDYVVDRGTLSEVEASTIVRQITSAVAYLHARGIIHRDLKPGTVVLLLNYVLGSRGADVKIIDFGLAKLLDADDKTASFLGTRGYLAPEMLQREAYSMSVDMWALGIIVYVLLCGCLPFDDDGGKIANEKAARVRYFCRAYADGITVDDCLPIRCSCRQSSVYASRAGQVVCPRAQRIYSDICLVRSHLPPRKYQLKLTCAMQLFRGGLERPIHGRAGAGPSVGHGCTHAEQVPQVAQLPPLDQAGADQPEDERAHGIRERQRRGGLQQQRERQRAGDQRPETVPLRQAVQVRQPSNYVEICMIQVEAISILRSVHVARRSSVFRVPSRDSRVASPNAKADQASAPTLTCSFAPPPRRPRRRAARPRLLKARGRTEEIRALNLPAVRCPAAL